MPVFYNGHEIGNKRNKLSVNSKMQRGGAPAGKGQRNAPTRQVLGEGNNPTAASAE